MPKKATSYEPVFGGIVAALAAALLCFALVVGTSRETSHVATAFLLIVAARGIYWGIAQIVGYRNAKRDNVALTAPTLGTALGCVLIGLVLAAVTAIAYVVAPSHLGYIIASGIVAVLLLSFGVVVGVREGVWR